jgi:hypothetical protein
MPASFGHNALSRDGCGVAFIAPHPRHLVPMLRNAEKNQEPLALLNPVRLPYYFYVARQRPTHPVMRLEWVPDRLFRRGAMAEGPSPQHALS